MDKMNQLLEIFLKSTGVTIDSRNIIQGNLFFALKGEKSDGNNFAASAIEKGAIAVIDNKDFFVEEKTILVDDCLEALQELAKAYRSQLIIPVIGLTGSNGKTTTKELMHAVLSKKYKTFATKGNLNNHIGVPLSILSIKKEHDIAVIEMGANHQKEIEFLCSIAQPTHGLITNIGLAHLEGFGGPEGVKKGKAELFDYIKKTNGIIFANSGEKKLDDVYQGYEKIISYGLNGDEDFTAKIISNEQFAVVEINQTEIRSQLIGNYNADNLIAAACVGNYFGVDLSSIKSAIENYIPSNNRSEFRKIGENYFILDAYNANPSSMKAALDNFAAFPAEHKIAVLGDMLELGDYAVEEHKKIYDLAIASKFEEVIFVGPVFLNIAKPDNGIKIFADSESAADYFKNKNVSGKYILLKGSRGIKLEKIIEA